MYKQTWILGENDYKDAANVRQKVFIDEQKYPYELEFDELDKTSEHLVIYDKDKPIACGRLIDSSQGVFYLGRIAVLKEYRGKHIGKKVMDLLIERAKEKGATILKLGAQAYAVSFYENFGFTPYGVSYMDEHIEHIHMAKNLVFDNCLWLEFEDNLDAVLARRTFNAKNIQSAKIEITGLGFFEFHINGKPCTDDINIPAWSEYEKRDWAKINMPIYDTLSHRIYYLEYDITKLLNEGKNTLGVHVGSGWYGQHESMNEGFVRCGELKLCFKITIIDKDSKKLEICSDDKVKWSNSHIIKTNIYAGETHNARLAQDGWNENSFNDNHWKKANPVKAPKSLLCKQECPPDKAVRSIKPKLIREFGDCRLYDLSENVAGFAVCRFFETSRADETAYVRYSDDLNPDGSLDFHSTGGANRMQRDTFIHDGNSSRLYYPHFTWHAGRYFEVLGNMEVLDFKVVHTDIKKTSSFVSDNETLNWIYDTYVRTQLNNIHCSIPSDCPHRERLGYTGDGQLTSAACMTVFDARAMYKKWMQDIADCQDTFNGHVQHTAPFYGGGGGPGGWGGAIVIVPFNYYLFYGDKGILEQYYPHMIKYLAYMQSRCENYLVVREEEKGWCLGEWCTPNNDIEIPEPFVNTYFFIKTAKIAKKTAEILGTNKDNKEIDLIIENCTKALYDNYFSKATGSFCNGVQGADAFMVDIGLGDERTLKNIVKKYDDLGEYDTGIFGTDILTRILFENGFGDLAYKLLTNEKEISFHRMKRAGATTLWEEWEGTNSHSHPMFGAVVEYFFKYILGIKQNKDSTAFKEVIISPSSIKGLKYAKGEIETTRGKISVEVQWTNGKPHINVSAADNISVIIKQ